MAVRRSDFGRAQKLLNRSLVWNERGQLRPLSGEPALCVNPILGARTDAEAPARRRLADYATTTAPVLDFLRARGWPICVLSGVGSADEVHRDIVAALGIRDHAWPVPTTCADAHPARGSTDRRTAELVP